MTEQTQITFYLSQYGGKYHLPLIRWDSDEDFAVCRPTVMVNTHSTVWTTAANIKAGTHFPYICKRCAQIAAKWTEEDQS